MSETKQSTKPKVDGAAKPKLAASVKKAIVEIYSPVNGKFKTIDHISDNTFKTKMLGDGFYIEPSDDKFFSPIEGELVVAFPTKHAYGIRHKSGFEILVHIGLDTVKLNGQHFKSTIKPHDKLTKTSLLAQVDIKEVIKSYKTDCPVVFIKESMKDAKVTIVAKNNSIVKAGQLVAKVEIEPISEEAHIQAQLEQSGDKYTKIAKELIEKVGGLNNVVKIYNCVTRVRFHLVDTSLIKGKEIASMKGVKGVNMAPGGEYQVIYGADAARIADAANNNVLTNPKSSSSINAAPGMNSSAWSKFLKACMGIFGPLIPFFIGAGLFMAAQQLLVTIGWLTDPDLMGSQDTLIGTLTLDNSAFVAGAIFDKIPPGTPIPDISGDGIGDVNDVKLFLDASIMQSPTGYIGVYDRLPIPPEGITAIDKIINFMADTPFKIMGIMMLWSTAKYFKANQVVAIGIGLIMISPIIPTGADTVTLIEIGQNDAQWALENPSGIHLVMADPSKLDIALNIPENPQKDIIIKPFYSTVLVFIVIGIIYAYLSKAMTKKIPATADQLLNPLISITVCVLAAFLIVGPITQGIEALIGRVIDLIVEFPLGLGGIILGGTYQLFVILGIHSLIVIGAMLPMIMGQSSVVVAVMTFAGVFGQVGAALGVSFKTKDKELRTAALSASAPGLIAGITEPILYGINLPRLTPIVGGAIGGAIGGWLFVMTDTSWDAMAGMGGIIGLVGFTDDLIMGTVITIVSAAFGALFTVLLWKEIPSEEASVKKVTKRVTMFELTNSPAYVKLNNDLLSQGVGEAQRKNTLNAFIAEQQAKAKVFIDKLNNEATSLKSIKKQSKDFVNAAQQYKNATFLVERTLEKEEAKKAALFDKAMKFSTKKDPEKTSAHYKSLMEAYDAFNMQKQIDAYQLKADALKGAAETAEKGYVVLLDATHKNIVAILKEFATAMGRKEILSLQDSYYNAINSVAILMKRREALVPTYPEYYSKAKVQIAKALPQAN